MNIKKRLFNVVVFLTTLALLYLAFPILIIPSSLPAIYQVVVKNQSPNQLATAQPNNIDQLPDTDQSGIPIHQLTIPTQPTLKDKFDLVKYYHQQGMNKMLMKD